MSTISDVGIIGVGVAGAFALQRMLKTSKSLKIAIFDSGRPPLKRRHSLQGFLGCLPSGDGKLYVNNLNSVAKIAGHKKTNSANKWAMDQLHNVSDLKMIKDKRPSVAAERRMQKSGFDLELNDHYQIYPKHIHALSRTIVECMDKNKHIICSFDNEVLNVFKNKDHFLIVTAEGEHRCKRVIISVGRGGWRWASTLFNSFGIIESNDSAKFGIRAEMPISYMKDFNQSNCTLTHNLVEIGPFSWDGTVIPEDHIDLAVTSFRSNEARWNSDKVSFNITADKYYENKGFQELERIAKLTFILGNDRMTKERISTIMTKKSKISIMKEYDFLLQELQEINEVVPNLIDKGSFYTPCIQPYAPKIKLDEGFQSIVEGMHVIGESANVPGILGAAVSGVIAADHMVKS